MDLSVQNLYGLLLRSRLLGLSDAQVMFQRWHQEAGEAISHAGLFGRWLVAQGYVTEYQASLLARGYADGFFLGPYRILDRCGKGRMAGVYKAVHELGQVVAIKVLPPSKARDPMLLGRFQREAQLAVSLQHPHIVRTFQVGNEGDLYYLVMEYLEGETLDELLLRQGKLSPPEAVSMAYQALSGLQHFYDMGLVHRDLKPANLMILKRPSLARADRYGEYFVKVIDVGLVRAITEEADPNGSVEGQLTAVGTLLGTPDYMAPEQARNAHAVDIRSDIYSLGCVLYHALSGQPPFPDSNIISQMIRHASEPLRPLVEFNPAIPNALQQVVSGMLAKAPAQRYATPERAARALEAFLVSQAGPARHESSSDVSLPDKLEEAKKSNSPGTGGSDSGEEPTLILSGIPPEDSPGYAIDTYGQTPEPGPIPAEPNAVPTVQQRSRSRHRNKLPKNKNKDLVSPDVRVPPANPISAVSLSCQPLPGQKSGARDRDLIIIPPVRASASPRNFPVPRLSRRDFAMFAMGAATMLLAFVLGKVLSILFPWK